MSERPYSVVLGRDKDVLPLLFEVHASGTDILDCTYNKGRMWRGTDFKPVRMDIDPKYDVDVVGDFRQIPFPDSSFDVLLFDPPFLPIAAGNNTVYTKYEVHALNGMREGDNINDLFMPFLQEAKRVLRNNGVVFAKLSDIVHNHHYQWHHVEYLNCVRKVGLTPCDLIVKIDPCAGNLKAPMWKNVKHFRKKHCYWIVSRKGKCEK